MKNIATDPEILDDLKAANLRVPVISWNCADDASSSNYNLVQIANGDADADLQAVRAQLLQLKFSTGAPYPVMLRYFWEFNINAANPPLYTNTDDMGGEAQGNGNNGCFVTPGTPVDGSPAPALTLQFTNAWNHIHAVLQGSQPVPNLTWDWNPNVVDAAAPAPTPVNPGPYYPGPNNVDWIGADGYDKVYNAAPLGFSGVFGAFVGEFASYGKPIIVGETGSCQQYPKVPGPDQVEYLQSIQSQLESLSGFPQIRAVMYFDENGQYSAPITGCDWTLGSTPAPGEPVSAIHQFSTLGADPYFMPTPGP